MNLLIESINLLEYKLKKLHFLKQEYGSCYFKNKKTLNLINQKIKECDDLLLKKYIELEKNRF